MNTPVKIIRKNLMTHPSIFKNRADVMNHLFLTIGTGYHWDNGEIVYDDTDVIVPTVEEAIQTIVKWHKYRNCRYTMLNLDLSMLAASAREATDDNELTLCIDETENAIRRNINRSTDRLVQDILQIVNIDRIYAEPLKSTVDLYPLCSSSNLYNIPDNITSEWKDCAKEFYEYITTEPEFNDYVKKYSNELNDIKIKLYG